MESKLVILLVVAALTRSSCAQKQSTVHGLSEEKSARFHRIVESQKATLSEGVNAIDPIFNLLEIMSFKKKYNLPDESLDVESLITGGLGRAQSATEATFDSISHLLGGSNCTAAETARPAAYEDLKNFFGAIGDAIALAVSGNYTDIRTEFEPLSATTNTSLGTFMERYFNAVRVCLNTTDADTLAAIELYENQSTKNLRLVGAVIFDAIKVFASGISTESSAAGIVQADINYYRKKSSSLLRYTVEHGFSPVRGIYVGTALNQSGIIAKMVSDQYTHFVSEHRHNEGFNVLFDVCKGYLTKVKLGLSDGCNGSSSTFEAAEAKTAEYFRDGIAPMVNLIPANESVASNSAAPIPEIFNLVNADTAILYEALRLARGVEGLDYSVTARKIQALKASPKVLLAKIVRASFGLFQLGTDIQTGILPLQDNSLMNVPNLVDNIFEGIDVVAKACHGVKPVTEDDFAIIENARNKTNPILGTFTSDISTGHVTMVKILNLLPIAIPTIPPIAVPNLLNINLGLGLNLG